MRILDDGYSVAVEMIINPSVELARYYPAFDEYEKLWVVSSRIPGIGIPVELDHAYKTEDDAWDAICGYISKILTLLKMSGYNLKQLDVECPDELRDFYEEVKIIHEGYIYSMYPPGMMERV